MVKQVGPALSALDMLRIAWAFSIIPLAVGFVMDTVAPFSNAPAPTRTEDVFVWIMFAVFAALQTAVTIVGWSRPHFTTRVFGALGICLLCLWPEYYIGATAAILFRWLLVLAAIVMTGIYLARFHRQRRPSPQNRRKP